MMKRLTVVVCLLATPALAQQPPGPPPPDSPQAALAAEVMECINGRVQLRQQVARLEAELAKAKDALKAEAPPAAAQTAPKDRQGATTPPPTSDSQK